LDHKKTLHYVKHGNETEHLNSQYVDIEKIFEKIAPYLANPTFINEFLKKHSSKSRNEIINTIEKDFEKYDQIQQTDFRILLNAI
jgi:hypothetical protein